jgi:hypothetical protein
MRHISKIIFTPVNNFYCPFLRQKRLKQDQNAKIRQKERQKVIN